MPLVDDLLPGGTRQSEGPLADARGSVRQRTRKNDEQNSTFCTTGSMANSVPKTWLRLNNVYVHDHDHEHAHVTVDVDVCVILNVADARRVLGVLCG